MNTLVAGLLITAWGIWCLWQAPALAARYERLCPRQFVRTAFRRGDWLHPLGWRLFGILWCSLGLWAVYAGLSH